MMMRDAGCADKNNLQDNIHKYIYWLNHWQVTLMLCFNNGRSQRLEFSRRRGILVSRERGCTGNGTNTSKGWCGEYFSFASWPEKSRSSGYLWVNNSNAPFALALTSWMLTTGWLNLFTQRSANPSAVFHWSVDLRPPLFFSSPVSFEGYR